jgi:hypothetical protein
MPYFLGLCVLRTPIESRFRNPHVVIFTLLNIIIIIKGEKTCMVIEAENKEECSRWLSTFHAHVEHIDSNMTSKFIF